MAQPIKTYSSGMRSRLGFAVAINVEPDVLVIDEALSAGDSAFKKKAIQRMYDLKDSGSTVLFVSHSMGMVKRFCTEAVLLHKGRLITTGSPEEVVDHYEEMLARSQEMKNAGPSELDEQLDYEIEHEEEDDAPTKGDGPPSKRTPNIVGGAEILGIELLDESGQPVDALPSGATLTVRVRLRYDEAVEDSTLSLALRSESAGLEVFSTDTALEGTPLGRKDEGEQTTVDFTFVMPFGPGNYKVDASLTDPQAEDSDVVLTRNAATLEITREGALAPVRGLVRLPTRVEIHPPEGRQEGPA
jgi:ABC-type Fe3+/spermidine/putrescine transport system ATPase subunit